MLKELMLSVLLPFFERRKTHIAAIASELSAQRYDVPVQERGIQDCFNNITRFLIIGKTRVRPYGGAVIR